MSRLNLVSKTKSRKFGKDTFYFYAAFVNGRPNKEVDALKKLKANVRVLKKKTNIIGTHYEVWVKKN